MTRVIWWTRFFYSYNLQILCFRTRFLTRKKYDFMENIHPWPKMLWANLFSLFYYWLWVSRTFKRRILLMFTLGGEQDFSTLFCPLLLSQYKIVLVILLKAEMYHLYYNIIIIFSFLLNICLITETGDQKHKKIYTNTYRILVKKN